MIQRSGSRPIFRRPSRFSPYSRLEKKSSSFGMKWDHVQSGSFKDHLPQVMYQRQLQLKYVQCTHTELKHRNPAIAVAATVHSRQHFPVQRRICRRRRVSLSTLELEVQQHRKCFSGGRVSVRLQGQAPHAGHKTLAVASFSTPTGVASTVNFVSVDWTQKL